MNHRSVRKWRGRAAIGIAVGIILIGVCLAVLLSCRVSRFEVSGNEFYTSEQIREASGISEGSFLFTVDRAAAQKRILEKCPRISLVSVGVSLFDRVVIRVTEEGALFSAVVDGKTVCFTENLRITGFDDAAGTIPVVLPPVLRAIAGQPLEFSGGEQKYAVEILTELAASPHFGRITAVDLSSARTATATVDGKYHLCFGGTQDLSLKLTVAFAMLEDERLSKVEGATLDLSDPKEVIVKLAD